MRKHKLIIALCTVLLGLSACSQSDELPQPPQPTGDEVVVKLSAGEQNLTLTRGAFTTPVPVTVLVFKRTVAGTPAPVTGTPYRTFKGITNGANLDAATAGEKLTVLSGFTYDFYAFANPKTELVDGTMSVANGNDLLVGKVLGKAVAKTDTSVPIAFGDLPHMGSQVQFTAYPNIGDDGFAETAISKFEVSKVTWSKLPSWGSLTLDPAATVQKLVTSTAYTSKFELVPAKKGGVSTSDPKWLVGGNGVILPFPLAVVGRMNRIDMQFSMNINDGGVDFNATDVEVPAFNPAMSYKFTLVLQAPEPETEVGSAKLYLSIVPWNSLEWVSGMGGDNGSGSETIIEVGSWSTVNWNAGMGGDNPSMTIISVAGWRSISWESVMGQPTQP